jgi:hypothetical protein
VTGTRADRREFNPMLAKLAPGDVVTVTRIDRLARSTFGLFGIVKRIVDAKAQFRSLAEPWAGTGTSTERLMLAVLGGLAEVERDLIRTRTPRAGAVPRPEESTWADPFPDAGTAEGGHHTARAGRCIAGIGRQLRPQHIHHTLRDETGVSSGKEQARAYDPGKRGLEETPSSGHAVVRPKGKTPAE